VQDRSASQIYRLERLAGCRIIAPRRSSSAHLHRPWRAAMARRTLSRLASTMARCLCRPYGLAGPPRTPRQMPAFRYRKGKSTPGTGHLGFDRFSQALLVTISISRRIKASGLLRDDHLCDRDRLGVDLARGRVELPARTSSAACVVKSGTPVPRGSTTTTRSPRLSVSGRRSLFTKRLI